MKSKLFKRILVTVMATAIVMTTTASVTIFAAEPTSESETVQTASEESIAYIEDHSIIDCTNRYKESTNEFHFTIKVPHSTSLSSVAVEITRDYNGTNLFYTNLLELSISGIWGSSVTLVNSYNGSDYYELVTNKFVAAGIGIRLYTNYNGSYYMATDTSNYSTTPGNGYWLSA